MSHGMSAGSACTSVSRLSVCLCVYMCVELLYRSDFFPGLGWLLLRHVWLELQPKWPAVYVFSHSLLRSVSK